MHATMHLHLFFLHTPIAHFTLPCAPLSLSLFPKQVCTYVITDRLALIRLFVDNAQRKASAKFIWQHAFLHLWMFEDGYMHF